LTEMTLAVESFQPTITTLRLPAPCAPGNATVTVDCGVCGTA